jgi:magnesium chelatase subunit I
VTDGPGIRLLPYCKVIGQEELKKVLEVAYVMGTERSGVLISGERGTAKSTIARSFAHMVWDKLPVNLPINATDDRVIGGWDIDSLMRGDQQPIWKAGLLRQANKRMLYIDEINLLEDHIINLILDPVSTGVLNPQRDGRDSTKTDADTDQGTAEEGDKGEVSFMLVGTMNPDEGPLRPQLLDRFPLYVPIKSEKSLEARKEILRNVLTFDLERRRAHSDWLSDGDKEDDDYKDKLLAAKELVAKNNEPDEALIDVCARVAEAFDVVGHRAEIVLARAATAHAARAVHIDDRPLVGNEQGPTPTAADVAEIAKYAVMHRREAANVGVFGWSESDEVRLKTVIAQVSGSERR